MNYNVQQTSMLIGTIKEDTVQIIFHPKLQKLYTGDSIKIIDDDDQGIITQVYRIENLSLASIEDETLNSQAAHFNSLTSSILTDDVNSLHIAHCKIKLSIIGNRWVNWRGNLPSMIDHVILSTPEEIISHTLGSSPLNPVNLGTFISETPVQLQFEASSLEKTTLIIGNTSKNKANLTNIIQKELTNKKAKVLIIDPKGLYKNLNNALVVNAGCNHKLSFLDYGPQKLGELITSQMEPKTRHLIDNLYSQIVERAESMTKGFLPFKTIKSILDKEMRTPEGQQHFNELNTLKNRLSSIINLGIFADSPENTHRINDLFEQTNLIVLDISSVPSFWQKTFTQKAIQELTEYNGGSFVFYDDISKYMDQEMAIELLYKSNNDGLNNIFITNYDDIIPTELIKQSENLFLFANDVLEDNPKFFNNLKTDKELLSMLLKRQNENTVLMYGDISNYYPILVELNDSNLDALKTKHFGSIKKYISECGEIIYSYKPLDQMAPAAPKMRPIAQPEQEYIPQESFESYIEDTTPHIIPSIPQPAYMERYQSISEEYDEELMTEDEHTQEFNQFQPDGSSITFHNELDDTDEPHMFPKQHIGHHIPDDEFLTEDLLQQQTHSHRIPDNEFLTQELIQQDHHSHSHKIPDDEFFTETMLQQQQPQYHHQQHSHQIPDEEFFTEDLIQPQHAPQQMQQQRQMQQPQQRPQPQQQMQPHPQHHSHQIPDDEFFPTHQVQEHVQQNIQPKQFHQQIRPESIPDQVEDIPVYASAHLDNPINFKEGDKVRHERYGIGVINRIIPTGDKHLYSIQFQDYGRRLLDPNRGLVKVD